MIMPRNFELIMIQGYELQLNCLIPRDQSFGRIKKLLTFDIFLCNCMHVCRSDSE